LPEYRPKSTSAFRLAGGHPYEYLHLLADLSLEIWDIGHPTSATIRLEVTDDQDVEAALRALGFETSSPRRIELGPVLISWDLLVATGEAMDRQRLEWLAHQAARAADDTAGWVHRVDVSLNGLGGQLDRIESIRVSLVESDVVEFSWQGDASKVPWQPLRDALCRVAARHGGVSIS
jgi:hypothetical protein